jgi:hypothetical protein
MKASHSLSRPRKPADSGFSDRMAEARQQGNRQNITHNTSCEQFETIGQYSCLICLIHVTGFGMIHVLGKHRFSGIEGRPERGGPACL